MAVLDTKELRVALKACGQAIPRKPSAPITWSVLMQCEDGKLVIQSTDLEKAVTVRVPFKGEDIDRMCVPYKVLSKYVGSGDGEVKISKAAPRCVISRGDMGTVAVETAKVADFPPIPSNDKIDWHSVDAKGFCRALARVVAACAADNSRPVLTGVWVKDGVLAAADGFRLHVQEDKRFIFGLGDKEAIVPAETVRNAASIFGKCETMDVGFALAESRVYFKARDVSLVSQLVQGTYPRFSQLIPLVFQSAASFSVPLMLDRIKMVDWTHSSGILRVQFGRTEHNEDVCQIMALSDNAEYDLSLPAKVETPMMGKIAVSPKYFSDALKSFSVCRLELTSPASPMKLTGDIKGFTAVIMPMFVQW